MSLSDYISYQLDWTQHNILVDLQQGRNCLLHGFYDNLLVKVREILCRDKHVALATMGGAMGDPYMTVHRVFGFGKEEIELLEKKDIRSFEERIKFQFRKKKKDREELQRIDILLLDNISLLTLKMLKAMMITARVYRNQHRSFFGGIIVLFAGDFRLSTQEELVFKSSTWEHLFQCHYSLYMPLRRCFPLTDVLTHLSLNSLREKHFTSLHERVIDGSPMDPEILPRAKRVFQSNRLVMEYHQRLLASKGQKDFFVGAKVKLKSGQQECAHIKSMICDQVVLEKENGEFLETTKDDIRLFEARTISSLFAETKSLSNIFYLPSKRVSDFYLVLSKVSTLEDFSVPFLPKSLNHSKEVMDYINLLFKKREKTKYLE